jgi:hypothetical protein
MTAEVGGIVDLESASGIHEIDRAIAQLADLKRSAGGDSRRLIGDQRATLAVAGEIEDIVEVVERQARAVVPSFTVSWCVVAS